DLSTAGDSVNLGFSLSTDNLYISTGEKILDGLRAGDFVSLWSTVRSADTPGEYLFDVYLAGDENPLFSGRRKLAIESEPTLGDSVVNAIAIGMNESGGDGALQIDWIAAKAGVFPPGSGSCGARFRRGDVDGNGVPGIGDAIVSLNYLFGGVPAPSCLDAADADDDGKITIGDAVLILNYIFAEGRAPALPGPTTCGADPTEDSLGPCFDPSCP
ncbi:MAG: hypothetical protein JXP34_16690, partial [Planctomycetes bacterium]|nr:hypothetical protein [Planctomycetota bacterium]